MPLSPPLQNTASPQELEPDASDLDKIKKWQEDRRSRKLRGEYESAVHHLSVIVNNNLTTPLRIASVRVEGAASTRKSFLAWLINPQLQSTAQTLNTSNLESILHTTRRIGDLLQETDAFKTVEAGLEGSKGVFSDPGDIDVVFKTRENGRYFLKTATEMGNGEADASIIARARNAFGGAETFEANVSLGTKTRRAYQGSFSLPLTPSLDTTGILSIFGMDRDNSNFASSTEGLRGLKATIRNRLTCDSHHELAYEAVYRHVGNLTPTASISMREASGLSLKSSLSHTLVCDTRDDKLTGNRGFYMKVFQELAGLGGDAKFHKFEAEGQLSRSLVSGTWVSLAVRAGHIHSIGDGANYFSDRFQLGGPLSIRSFKTNSMGPRDGPDSLGGDMYWSTGLSIISGIPKKGHWPLKTHLFINAGRLEAKKSSKSLQDNILDCISKPSVSAGVGLVYRFDPSVRVEVNFGVPLVASKTDGSMRGFQVGIGLDFL